MFIELALFLFHMGYILCKLYLYYYSLYIVYLHINAANKKSIYEFDNYCLFIFCIKTFNKKIFLLVLNF